MSGPIRKKSYNVVFKLQNVSKTETSSIRAVAREAGVMRNGFVSGKTGNGIGRNDEEARRDSMQGPKTSFRRWEKGSVPGTRKIDCAPHLATESPACSCGAQGCSSLC